MFQERLTLTITKEDPIFVVYDRDFVNNEEKNKLFKLFEKEIKYSSDETSKIKLFGKEIIIPRKQVAFGEKGTTYTFSGTTVNAIDWNQDNELCDVLKTLKNKIASTFRFDPNFVLINRYEDGDQYIGYHSDDEKDLIKDSPIVGISLGAEREILFKSNKTGKIKSVLLQNGSAFCMYSPTNDNYKHSIPKRKGVTRPRISLTFRQMNLKN